jgi:hypothetical protein
LGQGADSPSPASGLKGGGANHAPFGAVLSDCRSQGALADLLVSIVALSPIAVRTLIAVMGASKSARARNACRDSAGSRCSRPEARHCPGAAPASPTRIIRSPPRCGIAYYLACGMGTNVSCADSHDGRTIRGWRSRLAARRTIGREVLAGLVEQSAESPLNEH